MKYIADPWIWICFAMMPLQTWPIARLVALSKGAEAPTQSTTVATWIAQALAILGLLAFVGYVYGGIALSISFIRCRFAPSVDPYLNAYTVGLLLSAGMAIWVLFGADQRRREAERSALRPKDGTD
jgi:hypothetical protein